MGVDRDFDGLPRLAGEVGGGPIARPFPWGPTIPTVERTLAFPANVYVEEQACVTPDGRVWFAGGPGDTYSGVSLFCWNPDSPETITSFELAPDNGITGPGAAGYTGGVIYAPSHGVLIVSSSDRSNADANGFFIIDPANPEFDPTFIPTSRQYTTPYTMCWSSRSHKVYAANGNDMTAPPTVAGDNRIAVLDLDTHAVTYLDGPTKHVIGQLQELPDGTMRYPLASSVANVGIIDPANDSYSEIIGVAGSFGGEFAYIAELDKLLTFNGASLGTTDAAAPFGNYAAHVGATHNSWGQARNHRNGLVYVNGYEDSSGKDGCAAVAAASLRYVINFDLADDLDFTAPGGFAYTTLWHPGIERVIVTCQDFIGAASMAVLT